MPFDPTMVIHTKRGSSGFCQGCGQKKTFEEVDLDHIIPEHLGGSSLLENSQILCRYPCHVIKSQDEIAVLDANTRLYGAKKRLNGEQAADPSAPSVADCQKEVKHCEDRRQLRTVIQAGIRSLNLLIRPEEEPNKAAENQKQPKNQKNKKKSKKFAKYQKNQTDEQKKRADDQKKQTDEQITPVEEQIKPVDEQIKPAYEQKKPADEQIKPADEQKEPADEQKKPADQSTQLTDLVRDLSLVRTFLHSDQKELRRQQKGGYQEKYREQLKDEILRDAINKRNADRLVKGQPPEEEFDGGKPQGALPLFVPPPPHIQRRIVAWKQSTAALVAQVNDFGSILAARLPKLKMPIAVLGPDLDELKKLLDPLRDRLMAANRQYEDVAVWTQPYGRKAIVEEQKKTAEEQEKTRDEQKKTAEEQRKIGEEQKKTVEEYKKAAEEQKKLADEWKKTAEEQQNIGEEQKKKAEEYKKQADQWKKQVAQWTTRPDEQNKQKDDEQVPQSETQTHTASAGRTKRPAPDAKSSVPKRGKPVEDASSSGFSIAEINQAKQATLDEAASAVLAYGGQCPYCTEHMENPGRGCACQREKGRLRTLALIQPPIPAAEQKGAEVAGCNFCRGATCFLCKNV